MKTSSLYVVAATLFATLAIIGCGKEKAGNNYMQCDQWGCRDSRYAYNNGFYGFSNVTPGNTKTIVLTGGVTVTDRGAWQDIVKGLGACGDQTPYPLYINFNDRIMCHYRDEAAPRITVVLDDYEFKGMGMSTTGTLVIGSQTAGTYPYSVTWHMINENKGFGWQGLPRSEYRGRMMSVEVTGLPTDSQVVVRLLSGGNIAGTGYLTRQNR